MELTQACVIVQLLQQHVIRLPIYISVSGGKFEMKVNESFFQLKSIHGICLEIRKLLFFSIPMFSLVYMEHLRENWRKGNNAEQLCIYTLILCLTGMSFVALSTLEEERNELAFAITQSLKLVGLRKQDRPFWKESLSFKGTLVFTIFGSIAITCTMLSIGFALLLDYHLLKLILSWCLPPNINELYYEVFIAAFSIVVYSWLVLHGGGAVLFLLTWILSICEALHLISERLAETHELSLHQRFSAHLKHFRHLQVLLRATNVAAGDFLRTLIMMGIGLSVCGGYTLTKLRDLPLTVYLIISPHFPISVTLCFTLCTLAALPNENAVKFMRFWRGKMISKGDRARLRSCPDLCYTFGFVTNCQRRTGLTIVEMEVDAIASLTLIQ